MHIVIIGAGIIGLSIGWQLARRGHNVEIFERDLVARAASHAAAGMLCPLSEAHFDDAHFLELAQKSMLLYPQFLQDLSLDAHIPVSFESEGTLFVGIDRDDRAELERRFDKSLHISSQQARALEPLLSPRITSAIFLPQEAQIDNRKMLLALRQALLQQNGLLHENSPVLSLWQEDNKLLGVHTPQGFIGCDLVVNACGAWTDAPTVRPNKGQILTLRMQEGLRLQRVVRTPRVYLAPKQDGTLRVGSTSEEKGFDPSVTAGAVLELLQEAYDAVPAVAEMELVETAAQFRPLSSDRLPLLEESELPHYYRAAGHGRSGFLLAPLTAHWMCKTCESL